MVKNDYYKMPNDKANGKKNLGAMFSVILLVAAVFFILSAIIMALWNGPLMKALKKDAIRKINYPTAMGLTFFIMLIMPGGVYLVKN